MDPLSTISEEIIAEIHGHIVDVFGALSNGFQKLEKIKDSSRQLEELTQKMRECKRLIKEFDKEVKALEGSLDRETNKMLSEKKQSMIKELNSYVALKRQYATNIENKRNDLFEGPSQGYAEENVRLATCRSLRGESKTKGMEEMPILLPINTSSLASALPCHSPVTGIGMTSHVGSPPMIRTVSVNHSLQGSSCSNRLASEGGRGME